MSNFKPMGATLVAEAMRFFEIKSLRGNSAATVRARASIALVLAAYGWTSGRIGSRIGIDGSSVRIMLMRARAQLAEGSDRELRDAVRHLENLLPGGSAAQ